MPCKILSYYIFTCVGISELLPSASQPMADGNNAGDPKSSNSPSSDHGAGGGGSGSTNPPDLGNAARLGSMESDTEENPQQAGRYMMNIGNSGSGGGKSHDLPNFHGSSGGGGGSSIESGYPHGSCNGFTNLHGSGDGGGSSGGYGSEHPYGFGHGYANLHWSGGSMVPFSPHYGDGSHLSGGGSRAIHQRAPGNVFNNLYSNSYGGARVWPQQAPMNITYAAVPRFLPNGDSVISHPPQRPVSIIDRLSSLTIGECYDVGRGGNTVAEFRNQGPRPDRRIAREQRNIVPANDRWVYAGGNNPPYWRMSLEDVKGRVSRVAKNVQGCQFLRRMMKERREDAVRYVFDEVAGEIVRLMGHGVGAEFVDAMARLWTDEQVARVIRTFGG